MATAKIAISLDEGTVKRLDRLVKNRIFPSRSKVIQDAVEEKLNKMGKGRLARECAKLDPEFEYPSRVALLKCRQPASGRFKSCEEIVELAVE